MNKQDILKTIIEIAKDKVDCEYDLHGNKIEVNPSLNSPILDTYKQIGLDSLDEIEIIMELEKHYGISILDDDIRENIKTFDDLCNIIIKQKPKTLNYRIKQNIQPTRPTFLQRVKQKLFQRTK